ncbi:MAG: NAD(P)-dependent oxidoreductase, partial [candidate division NC10 bacterium]|nr:NAD(P)-dependent oxidoreductase [candidate division NC10 bacterium]
MIIVDTALKKRAAEGNPIRVALVGAGYMGRGIALEILTAFPGMHLAVIVNRDVAAAKEAYRLGGIADPVEVRAAGALEGTVKSRLHAVTDDPAIACRAGNIDVVVETTGDVEYGAMVALDAIQHGKHVVLMNAEADSSVGPILKVHAD